MAGCPLPSPRSLFAYSLLLSIPPKDPTENYSVQEHVENGKRNTQLISTTKKESTADFYNKNGKVKVDLSKIPDEQVIDISRG
ncbi:hypothetical protein [Xenorhabdus sp. PB62.4]|uniref:hypothetical protein n=1 Tax=Xenorhabdus sp. PB62.4 TaxID=1851573 RepID=UPI0021036FD7|nr:hypothetical protein [Xenorhabdus sp. PB62.4]MBC8955083.1 hypothetical protein [Xenorhabdus sp. PB62.4]